MTILATKLLQTKGANPEIWGTTLDAADTTPKERLGTVRWDDHPVFGRRGFKYLRCHQSGGHTAGVIASFLAPVAINNISSGTTTTITTSGLTADIYVGGLLRCLDDAGAAGAAPEGEIAVITANTATVVTIDTNDAFSAAPAVNDDFTIVMPFACQTAAAGDVAGRVAGVAMTTIAQYSYGWYQFFGINPSVQAIAAGTAITTEKGIITANSGLASDGSTSAPSLLIGVALATLTSDTVLRRALVKLNCGDSFTFSISA